MGEGRDREYERLGVVIVTHTPEFLDECLRSVADQTVAPSATVVVDNASGTDRVHEIARRYRVPTIRLDSAVTPSAARNIGCSALADCGLVVNLDGDDLMKPRFLEVYWSTARVRQADVVFGAAELTGTARGVEFTREKLGPKPDLRRGNYVPVNSLFKWRLWREVGGFDPAIVWYEDWDFWLSVSERGATFEHVDEPLWCYRRHERSRLSTGDADERIRSKQQIRRKHRRHMYGLLQWRRVYWKVGSIRWSHVSYGALATLGRMARTHLFPGRVRRPLYESAVFDDLLFAQPANLLPRLAMRYGRRRAVGPTGVSVVVVNYNTQRLLEVVLAAIRRFSPDDTEVIVVDNASRKDASRRWLKTRPFGVRPICLPINIGHGRALDIGIAFARSPIVVTLDSDAFPFSPDWLPKLVGAFGDPEILAAGMTGPRDRLHPACAAFRRDAFFRFNTSLANYNLHLDRGEDPVFGVNTWDTGELLFERLGRQSVRLLPLAPSELGGWVMSDAVYHHPGSTTILVDAGARNPVVHSAAWDKAVAALLG